MKEMAGGMPEEVPFQWCCWKYVTFCFEYVWTCDFSNGTYDFFCFFWHHFVLLACPLYLAISLQGMQAAMKPALRMKIAEKNPTKNNPNNKYIKFLQYSIWRYGDWNLRYFFFPNMTLKYFFDRFLKISFLFNPSYLVSGFSFLAKI